MGEHLTYFNREEVNDRLIDNVTGGIVEHAHITEDGTLVMIVQHHDGKAQITVPSVSVTILDVDDDSPAVIPEVRPIPVVRETNPFDVCMDEHSQQCSHTPNVAYNDVAGRVTIQCNHCGYRINLVSA